MNRLWNVINLVLIIACFCYGILIIDALAAREAREVQEMAFIKKRMKYHGTEYAECQFGKCHFYRDGKKIRL